MELADELSLAAHAGDEAAVRQLLAAGARADQVDTKDRLPLHRASSCGHERMVRLLLEAAPATASVTDKQGQTALHYAANFMRHSPAAATAVVRLLLETAPATASVANSDGCTPLHVAALALTPDPAVVSLLLEAAPELAFAPNAAGRTPLYRLMHHGTAEQVAETARCLLRAAPAVQTALGILLQYSQHSATLYADLMARLSLSQEQWHSIPAPCPGLARALPAVLQRSAAEAGWLVGRLAEGQHKRLRAAALSLARAQRDVRSLPAELSGRILALCLLDP